jgi:glycerophosphoryl diester phosphodiesterase
MLIYAHRGASIDFIEGSKAAYLGALTQGADGFECDVRLTKDKQIICYHDSDTKRLSNIDLKIANTTSKELNLKVNPYYFADLLDLAIRNRKDLIIESKHPVRTGWLIEKELHCLLTKNTPQIQKSGIRVILISFSYLATLRNKKSGFQSGLLINKKFMARLNTTSVIAANIEIIKKDHSFVLDQKKRGKRIIAWTVNTQEDLNLCKELGIHAVITDKPALARSLATSLNQGW